MRLLGYYWGIAGVIIFLGYAVRRLSPRMLELSEHTLSPLQLLLVVVFVPWMAWAEGYKGFHRAFSPRVVARARYLKENQRPLLSLLAPIFCMGYFHATRKRMIVSWTLTTVIILLVLLLQITPQPWRGIIDAGVVTGLTLGIVSLLYYTVKSETGSWQHTIALDLPGSDSGVAGAQETGKASPGKAGF